MKHFFACLVLSLVAIAYIATPSTACADDSSTKNEKAKTATKASKTTEDAATSEKKKEDKKKDAKADKAKKEKKDPKKADTKKTKDSKKDAKKKDQGKKEAPKKTTKPAPKPPTVEVEKGPFEISLSLSGVFEAKNMDEISLWPDQWSGFTVLSSVEHGKHVKQGDLLIAFDPEKIDKAISSLRRQRKLANIEIRKLSEQLDAMEKLTPMDMAALERRQRIDKEDFEQLMKTDLPMAKEMAKFYVKMAEEELAYAKEELDQLEKMYKADDLTEETEELILTRQRTQ